MIDIVILCPIAVEYTAVRKCLTNWSAQKIIQYDLPFELGQIEAGQKKWTIALFETGKYIDNVHVKTSQILHALHPSYLFLIGVAGGVKDVKIGDLVVGTFAYGYEKGKVSEKGFEARPRVIPFSQELIDEAKQLSREISPTDYRIVFGPINSGDKVLASINAEQLSIIKKQYGDTIASEMEAIGFAEAAAKIKQLQMLSF
ncbi:MAG: nucleoside phosphorylase [Paraglaciecola sp.]|jgi:nucleoside phosphorylase